MYFNFHLFECYETVYVHDNYLLKGDMVLGVFLGRKTLTYQFWYVRSSFFRGFSREILLTYQNWYVSIFFDM